MLPNPKKRCPEASYGGGEGGSVMRGLVTWAQVAEEAVQRHAHGNTVSWLDHGTEHPHRIALSVHVSSLQDCLTHLHHGFQQHSVQVG